MERLGENSTPFLIELGSVTPPSVQLLPAKKYTGAPIGTSYDIRVYTGNKYRLQHRSVFMMRR